MDRLVEALPPLLTQTRNCVSHVPTHLAAMFCGATLSTKPSSRQQGSDPDVTGAGLLAGKPNGSLRSPARSPTFPARPSLQQHHVSCQNKRLGEGTVRAEPSDRETRQQAPNTGRGPERLGSTAAQLHSPGSGAAGTASLGAWSVSRPEPSRWHAPKGLSSRPSEPGAA